MNSIESAFRYGTALLLVFLMVFGRVMGRSEEDKAALLAASDILIGTEAVREMEGDGYVLLEVSKSEEYGKGHLANALNIWRGDYQAEGYPYKGICPSKAEVEALLGKLGVEVSDTIILYDEKGNVNALRVWWILHRYGYGPVLVMEGGKQKWMADGFPLTEEVVSPKKTDFKFVTQQNDEYYIDREGVLQAIGNPDFQILDVRLPNEYTGEKVKDGAFRGGHIPGSLLLRHDDAIYYDEGIPVGFKSPAALQAMFDTVGLSKSKNIIVYCHTGVRSALTTFVLGEVLGYPSVKNYDGSWVEWSYFQELPVDTGPPPPPALFAAQPSLPVAAVNVEAAEPKASKSSYLTIALNSYKNYWAYLKSEVTLGYDYKPKWQNFFYGLIVLSLFFYGLELIQPWRKKQKPIRKDFWLDAFYMFFNVFLFGLVIFSAAENVFVQAFHDFLGLFGIENLVALKIHELPAWAYFLILFVVADFIQWNVHRLLHRVPWMWEFHKLHHSVEEMGFAAHLRFHWMETIIYKTIQALPLTMIGYNLADLFVLHIFTLAWGHFNHSNITVPGRVSGTVFGGLVGLGLGSLYLTGPLPVIGAIAGGMLIGGLLLGPFMRYIFNSPEMHIWHHAWELPPSHKYGVNFGLTLAIWDYLFGTAYVPHSGRDVKLGFPRLEKYPKSFFKQLIYGFSRRKR